MEMFAGLVRVCDHYVIYMNDHNQVYLAVHNPAKNTRVSPTLRHTVLYHGLYQ